jgi:hypothetical protein
MRRMGTAEMHVLRAVAGYRMTEHKRDIDVREQRGMTYVNTVIRNA